jgi:hypothetical protein
MDEKQFSVSYKIGRVGGVIERIRLIETVVHISDPISREVSRFRLWI